MAIKESSQRITVISQRDVMLYITVADLSYSVCQIWTSSSSKDAALSVSQIESIGDLDMARSLLTTEDYMSDRNASHDDRLFGILNFPITAELSYAIGTIHVPLYTRASWMSKIVVTNRHPSRQIAGSTKDAVHMRFHCKEKVMHPCVCSWSHYIVGLQLKLAYAEVNRDEFDETLAFLTWRSQKLCIQSSSKFQMKLSYKVYLFCHAYLDFMNY